MASRPLTIIGRTALAAAALTVATSAGAAVITVDTFDDDAPGITWACQLRDAIEAANSDTAVGGCTAGSGADEIRFASNNVVWIELQDHLPEITAPLTISGSGVGRLHLHGQSSFALVDVAPVSGTVTIRDLTLYKGGSASAACLRAYRVEQLVVERVALVKCETVGGIDRTDAQMRDVQLLENGAGSHGSGNLSISNSSLTASRLTILDTFGIPLVLTSSTVSISDSHFRRNVGSFPALFVDPDSSATITDSVITDNTTSSWGVVYNGGTLHLRGTVIAGNSRHSDGSAARSIANLGELNTLGANLIGNNNNTYTAPIFPTGEPNANHDWVGSKSKPLEPNSWARTATGYFELN